MCAEEKKRAEGHTFAPPLLSLSRSPVCVAGNKKNRRHVEPEGEDERVRARKLQRIRGSEEEEARERERSERGSKRRKEAITLVRRLETTGLGRRGTGKSEDHGRKHDDGCRREKERTHTACLCVQAKAAGYESRRRQPRLAMFPRSCLAPCLAVLLTACMSGRGSEREGKRERERERELRRSILAALVVTLPPSIASDVGCRRLPISSSLVSLPPPLHVLLSSLLRLLMSKSA